MLIRGMIGSIIILHALIVFGGVLGGVVGYCQRKQWKDALGVAWTIGIAAVLEAMFGLSLMF